MSKVFITLIFSLIAILAHANELEPDSLCDEKLEKKYYSICYSQTHRQALWTFHKLTPQSINGLSKRKNNYRRDSKVADPVTKNDYKRSGYDRGHLVPAADMKLNKLSMSETFFMTNMSPQKPELNRQIWNSLEGGIRKMVKSFGEAFIVTAPILNTGLSQLPSNVSIPKYFYKIAYFPKKQLMRAYLFENRSHKGHKFTEFQVSVDQLEKLTGINFFEKLEDSLEARLEREVR